ncbi:hypothetical protein DFH09DRAFT_882709, partial [Mycena vulgaris]
ILKEKYSVFADMFTFPHPSPSMKTMEGSPVPTLHDDPAEIEVFLKAIFDSECIFHPPSAQTKLEGLIKVLRLAHKYDVPFLRRRALHHLGTVYHINLSEREFRFARGSNLSFKGSLVSCHLVTINVAPEVGALWPLPAAYYGACTWGIETVMKAGTSWDGLNEANKMACTIGHSTQ